MDCYPFSLDHWRRGCCRSVDFHGRYFQIIRPNIFSVDVGFCFASAQVACLGGDFAGSWMCGHDGLSHDIHVVRREGYGAYAHSMSEGAAYVVTGSNAEGLASIRVDAIADCQRDGNADCYILGV